MKSKKLGGYSSLSIENAPKINDQLPSPPPKLGLINNKKRKIVSCRMRLEVINAWNELTERYKKKSDMDIGKIDVLEMLIMKAHNEGKN
jgi:hypothetical protein